MSVAFNGTPADAAFVDAALAAAVDITAPELVEILTDVRQGVIWVNVNGVCVLRCCRIKQLDLGNTTMFREREYAA
jgi:hypothetical protein